MMAKKKNKKKKNKTYQLSKITVKYKPLNKRGWEIDGSGPDGYDEVNGFNVLVYSDGYYAATEFVSSDMHEIKDRIDKIKMTVKFYKNKERTNTITKNESEYLVTLEEDETYYEKLLEDLENL